MELLVLIVIIAVLAVLLLPAIARRQARSSKINCVNNVKQIGLAFKLWAGDNNGKYPMQLSVTNGGTMELVNSGMVFVHFLVMSNELNTPKILFCPEETDPAKSPAATFAYGTPSNAQGWIPFSGDTNVGYFVGVDADGARPSMLLCGDGNLAADGKTVKHGLQRVWTNSALAWVGPRHGSQGNIGFADNSVEQPKSSELQSVLIRTGIATNRLVIP